MLNWQLTFDNQSTERQNSAMIREEARLPAVSSSILFEIFPFVVVYGEDMVIQTIGRSLAQVSDKIVLPFEKIIRPPQGALIMLWETKLR